MLVCRRIAVFASTQLELFQSMALVRTLEDACGPLCLLLAGDRAGHERDLAVYRTSTWAGYAETLRVRGVPDGCRTGTLERVLDEERPWVVILPGALETPMGLAAVCSMAARRTGVAAVGLPAGDVSQLLRNQLAAGLAEASSRSADGDLASDYAFADFSSHGLWSGPTARARLKTILDDVESVHELPVIWPAGLHVALDILDWLRFAAGARLILTDRTDVQMSACLLRVPCVTLLERTNVPETVATGANLLAGSGSEEIQRAVGLMIRKLSRWPDPWLRQPE